MNDRQALFEAERSHLSAVAYRMLGSASEAEDVLQEAFLRFLGHEGGVESPRAFLTTIVARLCLDQLKSARARRETYVGLWLPEPLVTTNPPAQAPDARAELAESLSLAFLVLLEQLSPLERAAFLLREVFDWPFAEVAAVLETTENATRQLVARARAHINNDRSRYRACEEKKQELLRAFVAACATADPTALGQVLAADVVAHTDGGGKVPAATRAVFGRDRVVRYVLGVLERRPAGIVPDLAWINGEPGVVLREGAAVRAAVALSIVGDAIGDVWIFVNPDKLARVADGVFAFSS